MWTLEFEQNYKVSKAHWAVKALSSHAKANPPGLIIAIINIHSVKCSCKNTRIEHLLCITWGKQWDGYALHKNKAKFSIELYSVAQVHVQCRLVMHICFALLLGEKQWDGSALHKKGKAKFSIELYSIDSVHEQCRLAIQKPTSCTSRSTLDICTFQSELISRMKMWCLIGYLNGSRLILQ